MSDIDIVTKFIDAMVEDGLVESREELDGTHKVDPHPVIKGVWIVKHKDQWGWNDFVFIENEDAGDFNGPHGPGAGTTWEHSGPVELKEDGRGVYAEYPMEEMMRDDGELPEDMVIRWRPFEDAGFAGSDEHKPVEPAWKAGDKVYFVAFNESGWGSNTMVSEDGKRWDQFYCN